ncbi:hypothetical protein M011DRAFT_463296 [Sporormia fimetaria CBS 119925]|uniref:Uncharacterized protein n=1 Tax=Sporormia fimetaria CBS 119925 TaxID=1340428 RepID=A0A6A6VQ88_9PLEO|nr:hypothetical protein M011DRAFT_463296 [Sporormia fimetaria CBS 119925]
MDSVHTRSTAYEKLSNLYVLCNKLVDGVSEKMVLDTIVAIAKTKIDGSSSLILPTCYSIRIILDETTESDQARKALVDLYAEYGEKELEGKTTEEFSADFFVALSSRLMATRVRQNDKEEGAIKEVSTNSWW